MGIKAVVFDFGHVLKQPPEEARFEELRQIAGMDGQPFLEPYWRFREEYDRGTVSGPVYWQRVAATAGKRLSAAQMEELILRDAQLWMGMHPILLAWIKALRRQGLKTAVLSNMPREISAHLRRTAEWQGNFDALVFSGEVGVIKPQAEIYGVCLKALAVQPEEALFVDDRESNVKGAQAVGMHAVQFHSVPQLASDVQPFGLEASLGELATAG